MGFFSKSKSSSSVTNNIDNSDNSSRTLGGGVNSDENVILSDVSGSVVVNDLTGSVVENVVGDALQFLTSAVGDSIALSRQGQETIRDISGDAIAAADETTNERTTKSVVWAVGALGVALVLAWGLKK